MRVVACCPLAGNARRIGRTARFEPAHRLVAVAAQDEYVTSADRACRLRMYPLCRKSEQPLLHITVVSAPQYSALTASIHANVKIF
jgi:hypothetical protein